ncbi:MAG: hypothetical protein D6675_15275 [Gemmatimonadetes bacterium]|nr:MAG: hypothetical protein D6675_15275 [Gemmatimonadota bacterium]
MRIFIIANLEGVGGVVCADWKQINPHEYNRIRQLQIDEINAAVTGAIEAGATKVIVRDFYGSMRNITHVDLYEDVELISGPLTSQIGAEFATFAEPCDMVFLMGFHSDLSSGKGFSLAHLSEVMHIEINDRAYGEVGVLAAVAGHYSIPVGLVTGDASLIDSVHEMLPGTQTVATKIAYSSMAARCLHPHHVCQEIQSAARTAIVKANEIPPYIIEPPIHLKATFPRTTLCDIAEWIPGVQRVDGYQISLVGVNMIETYRTIYLLSCLDAIEKNLT